MSTNVQPNYNSKKIFVKSVNDFLTSYFGTNLGNVKRLKKLDITKNISNKTNITELLTKFDSASYSTLIQNNVYKMIITSNMIQPNSNGTLNQNQTLLSAIKRVKGLLDTLFTSINEKTINIITETKETLNNIINNIPTIEQNTTINTLTTYAQDNLKSIHGYQQTYTQDIQNKINSILGNQNNFNMLSFINTIFVNYINGIKNAYVAFYLQEYEVNFNQILSSKDPNTIIDEYINLKTKLEQMLNDVEFIGVNKNREDFIALYNNFIENIRTFLSYNDRINNLINDISFTLRETYKAFLDIKKNNSGNSIIPTNKKINITNKNIENIYNPFKNIKLIQNKNNVNNKIKNAAEKYIISIGNKIKQYETQKNQIIELINQINPLLIKALQLKSNINKGSTSFTNFKNKLKNIQKIQNLQLNQLNNSNLKTLLQTLRQLLNKLVNTTVHVNGPNPVNKTINDRKKYSRNNLIRNAIALRNNPATEQSKKNRMITLLSSLKNPQYYTRPGAALEQKIMLQIPNSKK